MLWMLSLSYTNECKVQQLVFMDPDWEGKATLRYLTNQVETVKGDALCRG